MGYEHTIFHLSFLISHFSLPGKGKRNRELGGTVSYTLTFRPAEIGARRYEHIVVVRMAMKNDKNDK
jgi:hypothetical protein